MTHIIQSVPRYAAAACRTVAPYRWRAVLTTLLTMSLLGVPGTAAATELRLSTLAQPNSEGHEYALQFAERVEEATNGEISIKVYPANQLGDWAEVHEQVMQGAVDMALQSLSTKFDKVLALAWFPYTVDTYAAAAEAYAEGGYIYEVVDDALAKQDIKLLGVYGNGMGGAGFSKIVNNPGNPDANHDLKVRVWPGGTTHIALMERFGFQTAPIPWAEVYTSMSTGIVDGLIGGTPELQVQNFKDITKMWIQYNDHFEPTWLVANRSRYESFPEEQRQAILDIAQELSNERFKAMQASDEKYLQEMRDAGVKVVTFNDEELAAFAKAAREDVWPKIQDEIGKENMDRIKAELGL